MKTNLTSLATMVCALIWAQASSAQTYVHIASTPEGCHIYLSGKDFVAEGCNVHVRDASGFTWCDHVNATPPTTDNCDNTGNLIIGWNEDASGPYARNGNHNLIVGDENNYTAYGALVAGNRNEVSGPYASVSGGYRNSALGLNSSICGGIFGKASGTNSTIAGGFSNEVASSSNAGTALGGVDNAVTSQWATTVGGAENVAAGQSSTILGGVGEVSQFSETVIADHLTVATGTIAMPANGSGNTVIAANGRSGPYTISFGQTMPCTPVVTTQMYNSGSSQVAPFILSVNSVTPTAFTYYLINPSNSSQTAATATIHWTLICD